MSWSWLSILLKDIQQTYVYLAQQKTWQTHSVRLQRLSNLAYKAAEKNETTKGVPVLFNYLSPPACLSVSTKMVVMPHISLTLCPKPTISLTFTASLSFSLFVSLVHTIGLLSLGPVWCWTPYSRAFSPFLSPSLFSLKYPPTLFIYIGRAEVHSSPARLSLSPLCPFSW